MAAAAVRAVLLDLDGTLLHTAPDLAEAANRALAEFGLPAIGLPVIERFVGKGIDTLVRRCLAHLGSDGDEARFSAVRAAYVRHYAAVNGTHARPYPGVLEGLAAMRAMGLALGVCTNKLAAFSEPLLARCNMAHYFSLVVSGDTTPRKKPHADMLVHAANHWGTTVSSMLMIGDSGNDSAAARAAGCRVWLVPYGYNEGEPVHGLDCDGIVSSLEEAAARLRPALR
ncbi:MAG: phosphoglycolate phosphatase [Burkholderiales bacterium]|nr:phosphoglycolate phosphatase [Burkholderiales bacterium]